MAKTVDQIREQIARLQEQERVLLNKEVAGVIDRIKAAVAHYGLTPAQIFGSSTATVRTAPARTKAPKVARKKRALAKPEVPAAATGTAQAPATTRSAKGTKVAIKYRDDSGNSWSGRGSQPRWLRAAVEGGKKIEDFLVA